MLDPFKDEIHRLLQADPRLPGQRVRELIAQLRFDGGKTIVDDYPREVRPLFAPSPRAFQRTVYRPGEVCQFDLWEPKSEVPVGHGQTRRGWVVVACLGYSRAGAGALIFTKQTPDLLAGIARCLWSLEALPGTLVWDRQAGIHGHGGRPSEDFAAFCGQLKVDWHFCEPRDPQAKGVVERLKGTSHPTKRRARRRQACLGRTRTAARVRNPARRRARQAAEAAQSWRARSGVAQSAAGRLGASTRVSA